jgi:hypothetical protein
MKSKGLTIFGVITLVLLSLANLAHAPFLFAVIEERIKAGDTNSIGKAFAAVFTLLVEIPCVPILIAATVYFVLHKGRRSSRGVLITCIVLTALLLLQAALSHAFIWL